MEKKERRNYLENRRLYLFFHLYSFSTCISLEKAKSFNNFRLIQNLKRTTTITKKQGF